MKQKSEVSPEKQEQIKQALLKTYFRDTDRSILSSKFGLMDIKANVNERYQQSLNYVVPWVERHTILEGKNILEIGCGTGSSTAAFAQQKGFIFALDIDEKSLEAARKRHQIMGLENVSFFLTTADDLLDEIKKICANIKIDAILLFAVLEHMSIEERHAVLHNCWQILPENGLIIITETPNLLQYFDYHTAVLPFFHLLHSDLCARYAFKSPREGFNNDFSVSESVTEIDLKMTRWGRGVSFHDFELALGDHYSRNIVANGYEPEIMRWYPGCVEEDILRFYVQHLGLQIPDAMCRSVLNFILKKQQIASEVHLPTPPPLRVGDISALQDLERYKLALDEKSILIDQILGSKRWKIGNAIGSPYRLLKRLLTGKDV